MALRGWLAPGSSVPIYLAVIGLSIWGAYSLGGQDREWALAKDDRWFQLKDCRKTTELYVYVCQRPGWDDDYFKASYHLLDGATH